MKLNNKGMSIVEIVLTFAIIMIITTGLLVIVVNYRNKVSVSSERLTMDTFKNNITQDIYDDIYKYGLKAVYEYNEITVPNTIEELRIKLRNNDDYKTISQLSYNTSFDEARDDILNGLKNHNLLTGGDSDIKNKLIRDISLELSKYYSECYLLSNIDDNGTRELNRCINIVFKDDTSKMFGTSKVEDTKESIENKYLYYDGLKYTIPDKLPNRIPKDANGNDRAFRDLQRVKMSDEGIL